jgi:hypothetical protein
MIETAIDTRLRKSPGLMMDAETLQAFSELRELWLDTVDLLEKL